MAEGDDAFGQDDWHISSLIHTCTFRYLLNVTHLPGGVWDEHHRYRLF